MLQFSSLGDFMIDERENHLSQKRFFAVQDTHHYASLVIEPAIQILFQCKFSCSLKTWITIYCIAAYSIFLNDFGDCGKIWLVERR